MKPLFTHDCHHCIFLGSIELEDGPHDLYYCGPGKLQHATVVARFGNEGSEYQSGMNSNLPELIEAQRRAVERGLHDITTVV